MRRVAIAAAAVGLAAGAFLAVGQAGDGGSAEAPTIPHPEAVILVGEVPCPVVFTANGEPVSYKAPCRQDRDPGDRNVTRIFNADGVLIGGSTN